jgi:hypothetical protein
MEISEQELRAMIRDAIARNAGNVEAHEPEDPPRQNAGAMVRGHASHGRFLVVPSGDGECIIEPAVRCNHCGYCQSLGH